MAFACLALLACIERSDAVDAGGGRDASNGSDASREVCIGARPPVLAWSREPGPVRPDETDAGIPDAGPDAGGDAGAADASPEDAGPCATAPGTCIGVEAPVWALRDFQPQSCGYGATYGLDVFRGQVTVVAFWAGW